jgi:hypothetical protein
MARRWLLAVLVVVLAAAAVVSLSFAQRRVAGSPHAAPPDPTVWQRIEAAAGADGTVDLTTALQAFGYLFGPLPGVPAPAGRPDPADFRVSGSGPIRWVFRHWAELTDAQKDAVGRAIAPDEPPRLRTAPDKNTAKATLQQLLTTLVTEIGGGLGQTIPAPRLHLVDQEFAEENTSAWTFVLASGERVANAVKGTVIGRNDGRAARCEVYLPPSAWQGVSGLVPPQVEQTLAHELTHCFEGFVYPDLGKYRAAPSWLVEGSADWVGTTVTGVAPATRWEFYLLLDGPLFERKYTSMGWWFHLEHLGRNVWHILRTIWAGALDSDAAYVTAGGDLDDVYDTWAPSRLHAPVFGPAWDVYGIGVPQFGRSLPATLSAGRPATTGAFDVRVARLDPGPDSGEWIVRLSAGQPVRVHDNQSFEDVHITEGDYCIGEKCVCPDDTERAGQKFQKVTLPVWVAIPGGEVGTQAVTDTVSLRDYCVKKQPERKKPRQSTPQPAGFHPHGAATNPHGPADKPKPTTPAPAGTTGDPHLVTFAGRRYDFQAAGEFTLSKSDGAEIQVRQEPARRQDGTENTTVTVNTAVALSLAGDRVTIDGEGLTLRVDGTVDTSPGELPHGGTITPQPDGYLLTAPDGTKAWVLTAIPGTLNVLVEPAGKPAGLLGGTKTRLAGRDGKEYDEPYGPFADSWRVGEKSLFDYAPGESTATFTRPDVPTAPPTPTPEQLAAAQEACAAVQDPGLREHCVFDVAASGDPRFAVGYRSLEQVTPSGEGDVGIGDTVGPERLEPGQQKSFTVVDSAAKELFLAAERECSGLVVWQVSAPDGTRAGPAGVCNDLGKVRSATPGTWTIDVSIPPDAPEGADFGFRVLRPGASTTENATLPLTVPTRELPGPGAETRYLFTGAPGDRLTLRATVECDPDNPLEWGLENPDRYRITLRTPVCKDLGEQKLDVPGTWAIVIYNPTSNDHAAEYGFTATR